MTRLHFGRENPQSICTTREKTGYTAMRVHAG